MSFIPKPHEIYKHFKGNLYQITAVAEHTETGEQLVVYQALYGDFKTYARPLSMFTDRVDREKYPEAPQEFRFELQGPDGERQRAEAGTGLAPERAADTAPGQTPDAKAAERGSKAEAERGGETAAPAARTADGEWSKEENIEGELTLDPMVLEFLDADEYEQRLNILAGLHHRITDEMITTMAIACDVEIAEGDIEERYEALKACLLTRERYECNRIR
ncbi:MAG: DUF1653 domain-containing protein [Firmicutes bacterium]|nr:DUF1653 domain-containing protein [Bacillota bacterium]